MRIEQLELHNFRFFADSRFAFPAQFTVPIGENGRGKSALLHGLRIAAGAWLLGFKEAERLHIELAARFAPQFPAVVRAKGVVEGHAIEWARQRADFKGGMGRTGWAEAKQLIDLARGCDEATNDRMADVALPVVVYFSTARLWLGAKKGVGLKAKGSKIYDGYAQTLTSEHKRKGPSRRAMALAWIKTTYLKVLEGYNWLRTDLSTSSPVATPPIPRNWPSRLTGRKSDCDKRIFGKLRNGPVSTIKW
jgi:predicted ATP-binding protein involved in virulence